MKNNYSLKSIIIAALSGFIGGGSLVLIFVAFKIGSTPTQFSELETVYQTINQNYYKKVSDKKLMHGAIEGMIGSLNDPYSQFFADEDKNSFDDDVSGEISGIGVTIEKSHDGIKIGSVIGKSPAKKAGLQANDVIVKIDKHKTDNMSIEQASKLTRGKIGTKVELVIKRKQQTFTKTLRRAVIKVPSVSAKVLKDNPEVGVIEITQFSENTSVELKHKIQKLQKDGAKKLIIDVRSNSGGLMDQALAASSMFLPNGKKIMTVESRTSGTETYYAKKDYLDGYKVTIPTVVLVDNGTASAAEIFAASLKQSGGITVIGEKTFGKGVVQTLNPLTKDSEMKITTAKWLTPDGSWINKKGLKPTIKVKYPAYLNMKQFTSTKTIKLNQTNDDVEIAKKILNLLGYNVTVSNNLDQETAQQLQKFQSDHKLPASGNLDNNTRQELTKLLVKKAQDDDKMQQKALKVLEEK